MQKFFGYANRLLQQLSGWLVSDYLGGEDAGCGGPELVWLHVVCGCEPVGCTAKFSKTPLERAYGREINIHFTGNSLVDIPAVSMPIARSLKTCDICGIVLCDKTAHFRVPFFVASLRHTCAIIMLSNQHLDMPHL